MTEPKEAGLKMEAAEPILADTLARLGAKGIGGRDAAMALVLYGLEHFVQAACCQEHLIQSLWQAGELIASRIEFIEDGGLETKH